VSEAVEYAEALQKAAEAESRAMSLKRLAARVFSEIVIQYNEGAIIERQHQARAHPRYIQMEDDYIAAASEANRLRADADIALIKWKTWQSEHATARVLR